MPKVHLQKKCSANILDPSKKAKIDSNYRGKTITAGFFTKEDEEVNGLRKKSLPFLVYFVPSFVVKKLLTLKMYMDLCRT